MGEGVRGRRREQRQIVRVSRGSTRAERNEGKRGQCVCVYVCIYGSSLPEGRVSDEGGGCVWAGREEE